MKMIKRHRVGTIVVGLAALLFVVHEAAGADENALEIMKKSDKAQRLKTEKIEAKMILQKLDGEQQVRTLTTHSLFDDANGDKMRIRFTAPANVKGTALLTLENPNSDDDEQWLYLPAFRKTRRIGQSELGDRFVGSDIYFEDMQQREIEDYSYRILKSEKLDGQDCWVIESVPHNPKVKKESPYGKSHIWMRKDNYFIAMVRYFDTRLRPLKELRNEDLKQVTPQAWRANKTTVVDHQRKHRTVLLVEKREVNKTIAETLFSKHTLERAD